MVTRANDANESIPSPHHPTKTPPKVQSIWFPYLSSLLAGESQWTDRRDRPLISSSGA
jgi:hypothetical protein